MIDSPRLWYMLWWSAWTVGAAALAHVVVVRPITRRLDDIADEIADVQVLIGTLLERRDRG